MKRIYLVIGLSLAAWGWLMPSYSEEKVPPAFEKAADKANAQDPYAPDARESDPSDHDASKPDPFEYDAHGPKRVQVQVEFIELSHEALTKLYFLAGPNISDAANLRKQVQEMAEKKEAKVLETQIVVARSGQKSTSESIHEFIYPTEYEAPGLPVPGGDKEAKQEKSIPLATAFQTRNLGSNLEIEPTIGETDGLTDLRLIPELSWHTGDTCWQDVKDAAGNTSKITMPDIYTLRINTQITCVNHQYNLLGVLSPKDSKGDVDMSRKVMVYVKCDILHAK